MSLLIPRASRWMLAFPIMALHACMPERLPVEPEADGENVAASAVELSRSSRNNAAVYWNGVARDLVVSTLATTPFAIRAYAIVSVAQYQAAIAADKRFGSKPPAHLLGETGAGHGARPSVRAAISAASVVTLSYLFPAEAGALEARLEAFLSRPAWPGKGHGSRSAGIAIGKAIGEQMVARAEMDDFFAPWTGTVPVGPGLWFSSTVPPTPPAGAAFGQAKTFLLASGAQFRPLPPPVFGSGAFLAAVTEVRRISASRTPRQDSIAKFWHLPPGTYAPPGYWNDEASKLAVKYGLGDRDAAHALALMNIVSYDALVASHEAKYTYWLLRPSQADSRIQLSVGLPNFPSYPSNHAAISTGSARILGYVFPAERKRLNARAQEATWSRVLGGIHYRFDGKAGATLGRKVANWAIKHDPKGHPFVLR